MNAAIYCRVSTEDQEREGTSLHSQREACEKKARDLNLTISQIFLETFSGLSLDRPKLSALRELIRAHNVNIVIAYSLDRLSRDPVNFIILQDEMEKADIQLFFVTETVDSSDMGKLISHIRGFAAKLEAEKIKERTIRGKRQKAKEGVFVMGGPAPYGYYHVKNARGKNERRIDEEQAKIVTRIFTWIADEGSSLYKATLELQKAGILTSSGRQWTDISVCRLLHNPIYKGVTNVFTKTLVKKTKWKNTDKSTWINIPNATPAIVSTELWERAQEKLKQNRLKSKRNSEHDYLLAHRIRCGNCGQMMTGCFKENSPGKIIMYYRCCSHNRPNIFNDCRFPMIRAEKAEGVVWETIDELFRNPEKLLKEITEQKKEYDPSILEADEILLTNSIANIKREETRYLRLYGIGKMDEDAYIQEADRLKAQGVSLSTKLSGLKEQKKASIEAHGKLNKVSEELADFIKKLDNPTYQVKQQALELLDITVTAMPDGILKIKGLLPEVGEMSLMESR